jgi:hypothetical protein
MNQVISAYLKVSAKLIYLTKFSAMFLCVGLGKASVVLVCRQILVVKLVVGIASMSARVRLISIR